MTMSKKKMDENRQFPDRLPHIRKEALFSIAQSARILGVCRSYLYYCFENNPDFPKPTIYKGRRWLSGADLNRILEIRSINGR